MISFYVKSLIPYGDKLIYARKGQDKIFESRVDSVDAIFSSEDIENLQKTECPAFSKSWNKIKFSNSSDGEFLSYSSYSFSIWLENKRVDFSQSNLKEGQILIDGLNVDFLKVPSEKEDNELGDNVSKLIKIVLFFKENGATLQEQPLVTFHRDGSVRLGGYSDGSGYFPVRNDFPKTFYFFEKMGIEVVSEARPITKRDWEYSQWYKAVADHKPSSEQELEILKWLL